MLTCPPESPGPAFRGTRIALVSAMDSKAFHICPFCQATSPVADARCARCRRSLAGLTLPVYGSEIDEALSGREPQPLVDLPLREEAPVVSVPLSETAADRTPVTPAVMPAASAPPRSRRGATVGVAAAVLGVALVGGWLVRGQQPRSATGAVRPTAASPAPPSSVVAAPVATMPVSHAPAPVARVATPRPALARPAAARTAVMRPEPPPAPVMEDAAPARRVASRPGRRPAAEPIEDEGPVPPDIDMDPVEPAPPARGGVASRDSLPDETPVVDDPAVEPRASLADRLQRAEQRRETLATRVSRLRARANVPVIRNVEDHQRVQTELEAALDQQDRLDAQIARMRRQLERAGR